jgi:dihydroorotase
MRYLFKNVNIHTPDGEKRRDLVFLNGQPVFEAEAGQHPSLIPVSGHDLHLFPGFTDVHVHLREPGFSYKETILTGTRAAARGGFTTALAMPNLNPVPDSPDSLRVQMEMIRKQAVVRVLPLGAVTRGQQGRELADLAGMAPFVAAFSDDGRGVQDCALMKEAMRRCARLNRIIAAHCEDDSLTGGGWVHDGEWARAHGHRGIPSESEWRQVDRDLKLAQQTGCPYHICHVSTKESVDLIRRAKAQGVDVTCETAPHYLLLDDSRLMDQGRFKMNPPIRSAADREALLLGLQDGTIDMVATDHAPHSAEEKAGGLRYSMNGIVGLETAFAVLYTGLVRTGLISLKRLLDAMVYRPNARFGIRAARDWALFDLGVRDTVRPEDFLSKGRATPFEGSPVYGKCLLSVHEGQTAWVDGTIQAPEEQA